MIVCYSLGFALFVSLVTITGLQEEVYLEAYISLY